MPEHHEALHEYIKTPTFQHIAPSGCHHTVIGIKKASYLSGQGMHNRRDGWRPKKGSGVS